MARVAILADIHGNLEALEAVLRRVDDCAVDAVVCLGDLIGYGPDPGRCVDLAHSACDLIVMGNHDEAALVERTADRLNERARASLEHARDRLDRWQTGLLSLLPYGAEFRGVSLAHGSFGPDRFAYISKEGVAEACFGGMTTRIGAVGHTHIPAVFTLGPGEGAAPAGVRVAGEVEVELPRDETRVILNPGAIGQPRDRDPRASFGVLDLDELVFEVKRVEYDVETVQKRILEHGLPTFHAERLGAGV